MMLKIKWITCTYPMGNMIMVGRNESVLKNFFAKHLGLSLINVVNNDGRIDESKVVVLEKEKLKVFDAAHPRPAHAVQGDNAVAKLLK